MDLLALLTSGRIVHRLVEFEMGTGEIIGMLLFWSGLITLAFGLVNLLFPAIPPHHNDSSKKPGETGVNPHDKSMF